eukprot:NODE_10320_length_310_cov_4.109804.p5 GENE.NODE_10320_length_310_cov_4.109804~~NODE_10320_length_310_cov_4.109804.p5  ORF type:complete len:60 (+),score=0.61 NODE_10320_length_310_cov_4.109804:125-304(+)
MTEPRTTRLARVSASGLANDQVPECPLRPSFGEGPRAVTTGAGASLSCCWEMYGKRHDR